METQRITRKTFDAVVQEKMKRHGVSLDEAVADTLEQFHLEGPSRLPSQQFEPDYRDRERYFRDIPRDTHRDFIHDPMSRSQEIDLRRRDLSRSSYSGRDLSPVRLSDPLLDSLRAEDALAKEQNAIALLDARIRELNNLRKIRNDQLRSMDYIHNRYREPERDSMRASEFNSAPLKNYRELQMQAAFARGKMSKQQPLKMQRRSLFQKKKIASQQSGTSVHIPNDNNPLRKYSLQIVRWAKFNNIDEDLENQHSALFKVSTEACKKIVECFKCPMSPTHMEFCFSPVKIFSHPALKCPKIDNYLLDLLLEKQTVATKNEFFEAIKPFDKEIMGIQQYMLKSAIPLLMACNGYELKHSILTNERQLTDALKNTVLLCRKSIVLLGQTFSMATRARQSNILDKLGLNAMDLKPSDYPNMKTTFLFGDEFMEKMKDWLKKSGVKPVLKSKYLPAEKVKVKKPKCKVEVKEEKKAADAATIETLDQLLENTVKGDQTVEEKPAFWFLFDVDSNEYKYYRQKLAEFHKSKGRAFERSSQTKNLKRSPKAQSNESVRAMMYAKAVQGVRRRISRSFVFSKQQKKQQKKRQKKQQKKKQQKKKQQKKKGSLTKPSLNAIIKPKAEVPAAEMLKTEKTPEPPISTTATEPHISTALCPPETSESVKWEPPSDPDYSDVDDKTKDTAIKLAEFVAQMGPEIEQFSMENSTNNPELWFLHDKSSSAYSFYQSKVREFQQAAQDSPEVEFDDDDLENIQAGDAQPLQELDTTEMAAECEADVPISPECPLSAAFTQMPTPVRPSMPRKRVAKLKVGMLPAKRVCLVNEPNVVHDPVRIEYERPQGRGSKRRMKPVDLEFADRKLTQQNVGFQMLNKMGWKEGQGLGYSGSGITKPIKVGSVSSGEGLGVKKRKAAESTETNFDAFRQRMIQMYKQKIAK